MSVNLLVLIESRLLTDAHMDPIEWLGQSDPSEAINVCIRVHFL